MATNTSTSKNIKTTAPTPNLVKEVVRSDTLTIVVLNDKNQPAEGAEISIQPSGTSGVTNNAGEFQFKLGNYSKYEITASFDSSTVTVPYYVTSSGATRLVINPVYVESVEKQLNQSNHGNFSFMQSGGIILVVIIVLFIIWKLLRRNRS